MFYLRFGLALVPGTDRQFPFLRFLRMIQWSKTLNICPTFLEYLYSADIIIE